MIQLRKKKHVHLARQVWVNERGHVIGEDHHRAKLTDEDVDLVHALHAEGLSYRQIALKLDHVPGGVSKSAVRAIVTGARRGQTRVAVQRRE